MYVKIFSDILLSSLWSEDSDTRIVWLTMLVLADQSGMVRAGIPAISHQARVPIDATAEAIRKFEQPDPNSRTEAHEGRRIEKTEGGYVILNYAQYRDIAKAEDARVRNAKRQEAYRKRQEAYRKRQEAYRKRQEEEAKRQEEEAKCGANSDTPIADSNAPVTPSNALSQVRNAPVTESNTSDTDAYAYADADNSLIPPTPHETLGDSLHAAQNPKTDGDGEGQDCNWGNGTWQAFLNACDETWRPYLKKRRRQIVQHNPALALGHILDMCTADNKPKTADEVQRYLFYRLKNARPSDANYDKAKRLLRKATA